MRRLIEISAAAIVVLLIAAVLLLVLDDDLPPENAIPSAIALLVAGESMLIDFAKLGTVSKFAVAGLMVSGTLLLAIVFGFVVDQILRLRLEYVLGKRGILPMKDHIVLIGLGNVGFRTWQALKKFDPDTKLIVIEEREDNRNVPVVRDAGDVMMVENARVEGVLARAHIATARAVICATNDDLANLDFALTAREANPEIRVVLRMFDQRLAKKVQPAFGIRTAFSSAALAAPAFAAAAFDRSIVNSYYLGKIQVVTAQIDVAEESELTQMSVRAMEERFECALLKHIPHGGRSRLYPRDDHAVQAGDRLLVSCTYATLKKLKLSAGTLDD
jgi:Trk K+ transport system NAD-binding subunit